MSRDYIILIGSNKYSCRNDKNPIIFHRSIIFIRNEPILIKPKCLIHFMKYTVNPKPNEINAYSLSVLSIENLKRMLPLGRQTQDYRIGYHICMKYIETTEHCNCYDSIKTKYHVS